MSTGTQSLKSRNGEALPYRVTSVCWRVKVASLPQVWMETDSSPGFFREPGLGEALPPEIGTVALSQASWGGHCRGGFEGRTCEAGGQLLPL